MSAWVARCLLGVAELPYALAVRWRNHRFDTGHYGIQQLDVTVISIGNLTLGGTGKTPMVEWLARWFTERHLRVAIVSRGYGAAAGEQNDEALELARKLPSIPHLQNPDRVTAAQQAIADFGAQVIVLDDAFQHRRLARDLDIVLIDALAPFGYGHICPRGMLREPLTGLARADVIALSRADCVSTEQRTAIRREVEHLAPGKLWIEMSHVPRQLLSVDGNTADTTQYTGKRIAAFCGLGNSDGFRHTLTAAGYDLIGFRSFADHHRYTRGDIVSLSTWLEQLPQATAVLCTLKDLVKLETTQLAGRPLWALEIGLQIEAGQEQLKACLQCIEEKGKCVFSAK